MPFEIVQVGGGTGLFTTLPVFKSLQFLLDTRISAIVTVADDGGSTGRLRDEFGYLPAGDLRRALIALSQDTGTARKLFAYRFSKGNGLSGHSMGNLLLTALNDIYGDQYEALRQAARMLDVRGAVYPVSMDETRLVATLEDGTIIRGEANIDVPKHDGSLRIAEVALEPRPSIFPEARKAIENANLIVIGPGDLYTSVIPNILVAGFPEAVAEARRRGASVLYLPNLMTKHGETDGFSAKGFLAAVERHLGEGTITHVLCNTARPPQELLEKYAEERAEFVEPDIGARDGIVVIRRPLMGKRHFARHDPVLLQSALAELIQELKG